MYICTDCGKVFEDWEVITEVENPYGEEHCGLGVPRTRFIRIDTECLCGGEIVKAKECERCGEFTAEYRDLCFNCYDEYKTLDTVLEIGAEWECTVPLNGFLLSAFTKEDIEQILIDTLKNSEKEKLDKAIDKYCEEDIEYFRGYAERKWKEEK